MPCHHVIVILPQDLPLQVIFGRYDRSSSMQEVSFHLVEWKFLLEASHFTWLPLLFIVHLLIEVKGGEDIGK